MQSETPRCPAAMIVGKSMSPRMKAMRNLIAERALKRGRHLTASEQLQNLESGLGYAPGELRQKFLLNASNPAACAAAPANAEGNADG